MTADTMADTTKIRCNTRQYNDRNPSCTGISKGRCVMQPDIAFCTASNGDWHDRMLTRAILTLRQVMRAYESYAPKSEIRPNFLNDALSFSFWSKIWERPVLGCQSRIGYEILPVTAHWLHASGAIRHTSLVNLRNAMIRSACACACACALIKCYRLEWIDHYSVGNVIRRAYA